MRKFNKLYIIALIFTLIGVVLCQGLYALRAPIGIDKNRITEKYFALIIRQYSIVPSYQNVDIKGVLHLLTELYLEKDPIQTPVCTSVAVKNFYPNIKNSDRGALVVYAINELSKNLYLYSNHPNELLLQYIRFKNHEAIRIISRNKEKIKDPLPYLSGYRADVLGDQGWGFGLYFLKEFASLNEGVFFILDSNEQKISVSYDTVLHSEGTYPGTEIQMIILKPDTSLKDISGFKSIESLVCHQSRTSI